MLFVAIMALWGSAVLRSDTGSLADWVKNTNNAIVDGTVAPTLASPQGRYLEEMGAKEIRWGRPYQRPAGIVWVPTGEERKTSKNTRKEDAVAAPAAAKVGQKSQEASRVTTAGDKRSTQEMTDLGILTPEKPALGVSASEILSFFKKSSTITSNGNEETGAVISTSNTQPVQQTAAGSATLQQEP